MPAVEPSCDFRTVSLVGQLLLLFAIFSAEPETNLLLLRLLSIRIISSGWSSSIKQGVLPVSVMALSLEIPLSESICAKSVVVYIERTIWSRYHSVQVVQAE